MSRTWAGLRSGQSEPECRGTVRHVRPAPSSGVVELAVDRAEDEPCRLGALAAELLALVLLEGLHQVAEVLVHRGRSDEVARGEGRVEPCDRGPRVVHAVAFGRYELADVGPCPLGRG